MDEHASFAEKIADAALVSGTVQNITGRKRAEKAPRESGERLRQAHRLAMLGYWEWHLERNRMRLSPEVVSILRITPEELPSGFAEYVKLVHPDDRDRYSAVVKAAVNCQGEYEAEYRVIRPDGEFRFIRELGGILYDDAGMPVGVTGTIQDVTEHKRNQAQFVQASKLTTLGEMAMAMAHELIQPLNIIRMAADSTLDLIDEGEVDARYVGVKLKRISAQTERAARIIEHMRIFGRKMDEKPEAFDPRKVMDDALCLVRQQSHLRNIEVEAILPQRCRKVLGHAVQLEQVLLNLISNARDAIEASRHAPGDPRKISLIVEDKGQGNKVMLIVKDTGGGIPEAIISRIFEPLFTTKKADKRTGLGLSVSYGIISDMGGTINAATAHDGAVLTITLPPVEDQRAIA